MSMANLLSIEQKYIMRKYFIPNLLLSCPRLRYVLPVDQSSVFKSFDLSCLTSMCSLSNLKMKIQHTKNGFNLASYVHKQTTSDFFVVVNTIEPF